MSNSLSVMSFFEPVAPQDRRPTEPPPWLCAPRNVLGVPVPVKRILARTDAVVVALADLVAYSSGCQFGLQIAVRRAGRSEQEWRHLQDVLFESRWDGRDRGTLPDTVLRCGIQFADGIKVTNLEERPESNAREAPAPPVLVESGGGGRRGSTGEAHMTKELWLWPLPPPEPFTFAVEWPAMGVALTKCELDGEVIQRAGEAAEPFWPDDDAR